MAQGLTTTTATPRRAALPASHHPYVRDAQTFAPVFTLDAFEDWADSLDGADGLRALGLAGARVGFNG